MVKCLPEFEYFTEFLKHRNFILKIKRSKVTDYAALKEAFAHMQYASISHALVHIKIYINLTNLSSNYSRNVKGLHH